MTLEQLKDCKIAPSELVEAVKNRIAETCTDHDESDHIEDGFRFNFNGVDYSVICIEEDPWEDGGKYQYGGTTYQLVSYDKNAKGYCSKDSIIDHFDIEIYHPVNRSGSYFSDYYYNYCYPTVSRVITKHIPEQIIPAHDEVAYEEI